MSLLLTPDSRRTLFSLLQMQKEDKERLRLEEERKKQEAAQNRYFGLLSSQDSQQAGLLNYGQTPEQRQSDLGVAALRAGFPQLAAGHMKPEGAGEYGLNPSYGINPATGAPDYFVTDKQGRIKWMNTAGKVADPTNYQMLPGADGYVAVNTRDPSDVRAVMNPGAAIPTSGQGAPASQVKPVPKSGDRGQVPLAMLKEENKIHEEVEGIIPVNKQLAHVEKQIKSGALDLGLIRNLESRGRNYFGASDEISRNYASFKADLEKLRNASLRLNSGVQTEGDAQRAWDELLANLNDKKLVLQRLKEIQEMNNQAILSKESRINKFRANYNLKPVDLLNPSGAESNDSIDALVNKWRTR